MLLTKKKHTLIVSFSLLLSMQSMAQDMNSPYSAYGIGDIDQQHYNSGAGMGYTGIGIKSSAFTTGNNPASATGLPRSLLIVDANINASIVNYHGTPINSTNSASKDVTIKCLSVSEKLNRFWASSVGFRQYSSVNYQFETQHNIEGSSTKYTDYYTGDGGLNQYYWNNAFAIGKHFSAGLTTSFISGPINQTEEISDLNSLYIVSKRRDYFGNYHFESGVLYNTAINKKWSASAGVNYSPKTQMNYERLLTVTEGTTVIANDQFLKYSNFYLPASYGVGISVTNSKGATYAADYNLQNWDQLKIKGQGWQLANAHRISAGAEFAKMVQSKDLGALQPRSFQLGAYYSNSYLMVSGHQINEVGITAGIKRTIKNRLLLSAAFEAGTRGTVQDNLIRENFVKLSFSFSLRDYIYSHVKKYN